MEKVNIFLPIRRVLVAGMRVVVERLARHTGVGR